MAASEQAGSDYLTYEPDDVTSGVLALRSFSWAVVAFTFVFLINNYLVFWHGWPGVAPALGLIKSADASGLSWFQLLLYFLYLLHYRKAVKELPFVQR